MAYFNPYENLYKANQEAAKIRLDKAYANIANLKALPSPEAEQAPANVNNNTVGLIGAGLGGFQQGISNQGANFNTNYGGLFNAGLQGLAAGGPAGAAVGLATNFIGQEIANYRKIKDIDTSVQGPTVDIYGRPVFNGQAQIDASNVSGQLRSGLNKKIGGIGNPLTRKKAEDKAEELEANRKFAAQQYNNQMNQYNQRMDAQATYNNMLNNTNRLKNLYGIGTSLY